MSALAVVAGIIAIGIVKLLGGDKSKDSGKLMAGVFIAVLVLFTLLLLSFRDEDL
ncbi:hypothetical protein [Spirosoma spitsbergense]|uniref:hypothetical protein n=1 Tax=Spirosoma spitsbergense TaxID=431554 RepID=UPI00036AB48B|nr:hypothetical protein [Spirosoma spitsbergense]